MRFVYLVPYSMLHLIEVNSAEHLVRATHQLNCGGHIIWPAKLFDGSGFEESIFSRTLQGKSVPSTVVHSVSRKNILLPTGKVKCIIFDHSVVPLSIFQAAYSHVRVFSVAFMYRHHCDSLSVFSKATERAFIN